MTMIGRPVLFVYPPPSAWWADLALEDNDYDDGKYLGHITCWNCGGEGTIVACCDDLCHGQDWCMHGDNEMCRECHGEGFV